MIESKNVLITGTSTGIGLDCAREFLKNGYTVYGSVRKKEDADRLSSELGVFFHPLVFDVTDHQAIDEAANFLSNQIEEEGLCCLINNAGIAIGGPMLEVPVEMLRYQFEVNVFGLVKVTQAFSHLLGARENHKTKPGKVINISSIAGKVAMPFMGPYAGSKHALEGISGALRRELMLFDIDTIVIGPGAIKTPIWSKSTKREMAPYLKGPFGKALQQFQSVFIKKAVQKGFESDFVARRLFQIFKKTRPNARYSLVPHPLINSFVPRYFPQRFLDKFISRALGLYKPK